MISFPVGTDFVQAMIAEDIFGNLIDLTSASVLRVVVFPRPREADDEVLTLNLSSGVTVTDADEGEFTVTFADDDLPLGEYTGEAWAILGDGSQVLLGRFDIDVTESFALEA